MSRYRAVVRMVFAVAFLGGALGFFAFILVLGYSWPADGWWEDFLKNRAFTLVMAAALAPLLHVPERSRRA